MKIITGIWGDYVDTFKDALAVSLSWPSNREAIQGSDWVILAERKSFNDIYGVTYNLGLPEPTFIPLSSSGREKNQLSEEFVFAMQDCVDKQDKLLIALPDYIFGDGSIANMLQLAKTQNNICLSVVNVRALPGIMDDLPLTGLTNAQLVSLTFRHLHSSWLDAELSERANTYLSGVSWKRIEPDLYAVTHRLPPIYMSQPNSTDIDFLKQIGEFTAFDHRFPSKLIPEQRLRHIGSSDFAFIAEVTKSEDNTCLTAPLDPNDPLKFHRELFHNNINANYVSILRGGQ